MNKLQLDIQKFAGNSFTITGWETDTDTTNNTSYVYLKGTATTNSGTHNGNGTAYISFTASVGGQTKSSGNMYFSIGYSSSVSKDCKLGPFAHNADGSLGNVNVSAHCYIASSTTTYDKSMSIGMSTIPRKSTFSRSGSNLGEKMSVSISRASSSFKHKIYFAYGGSGYSLIASNIDTYYEFTPSLAIYGPKTPNNTSGTAYIKVETINGSTSLGYTETSFTSYIPDSVKPNISKVSIDETVSGLYAKFGGFVKNKSKAKVTVTASGNSGSTISSYSISINGTTYATNGCTTGALSTAGTNNYSVTVKDSRGRTTTKTGTYTVLDYANPVINTVKAIRNTSDGTKATVTLKGSISSVDNKNDKSFILQIRPKGGSYDTKNTYNTYSLDTSIELTNLSESTSYDVRLIAYDYFNTGGIIYNEIISTTFELVNFKSTGYGIAVGKFSETDNVFEIGIQTTSNKDITAKSFTPTSIEERKKNFEKFDNALEVVKDIDIYKYNFKDEEDDYKKHLGFVIGDNFKYSKIVTNNDNNGADLYSFVSLCLQAIKEQQEEIKELKEKIK